MGNQQDINRLIKAVSGQARVLSIPRIYIELFDGDIHTALFVSQCVYWSDKTRDEQGWFYKSADQWENELGLSYYQINRSAKKAGKFINKKLKKVNGAPTQHWRVDIEELSSSILNKLKNGISRNSKNIDIEETIDSINIDYQKNTDNGAKIPDEDPYTYFEEKHPQERKPKVAHTADERRASTAAALGKFAQTQAREKVDLSWMPEYQRPLAFAFVEAAGEQHRPVKADRKLWCKTLDAWIDLQFKPKQIADAIAYMRQEELTIGGPQSVTKCARDERKPDRSGEVSIVPKFRSE